jgi:hypothetical protein
MFFPELFVITILLLPGLQLQQKYKQPQITNYSFGIMSEVV